MATTHPLAPERNDSPDSPRRRVREAVLVGLLALTLNLAGNGRISLWDRDEPRYAGCHARDARQRRLAPPHLQRRAPLSQARPDLLADDGRDRARGRQPVRGPARLGAGRDRHLPARPGLGTADARGSRRALGRPDPGHGADRGGRVEAGDDRRHPGLPGGRLPVRALGAGARAVEGRGGRLLDLPGAGDADEGAGRPGLDRRLGGRLVVVGRPDRLLEGGCAGGGAWRASRC